MSDGLPQNEKAVSLDLKDDLEISASDIAYQATQDRRTTIDAALLVDPGLNHWSLRGLQFYLIVLCACCCTGTSGFDGTIIGSVNALLQYQHYFGLSGAGAKTSIIFGMTPLGSFVAALPASYIPDKFGRRLAMLFGNVILIAGALVSATAHGRGAFIAGRFLTGLGSSTANAAARAYLAEITPPKTRGFFLGFLNSFFYVGQMAATGMMVGTQKWNNDWSWRLPFLILLIPAALNALFIMLCPESPRWLFTTGKEDRARSVLAFLHSRTNDPNSPLIESELDGIAQNIKLRGTAKTWHWYDVRSLFRTRADRYRSAAAIMMGVFGQLAGNQLIQYFLPVLLGNAGITSQSEKLTLTFVNSVTSYAGALLGSLIVDRVGRRGLLISSMVGCVVCLAIVSGLLSGDTANATRSNAGIGFIFLFMVTYSFGWTPMQGIYATEVLSFQARAKGLAFLTIVSQCAGLINTFALPVALEKIGWKVYIIFLAWNIFAVAVLALCMVETKGLSLEEIETVFEQPNPRKFSIELRSRLKASRSATNQTP